MTGDGCVKDVVVVSSVGLMGQREEMRLKDLATKGDVQKLELKIAELRAEIIKWMFGVATGQAMFIIAILKMFPSH